MNLGLQRAHWEWDEGEDEEAPIRIGYEFMRTGTDYAAREGGKPLWPDEDTGYYEVHEVQVFNTIITDKLDCEMKFEDHDFTDIFVAAYEWAQKAIEEALK